MTISQAQRLLTYSRTLGYEAELHHADRRWLKGFADTSMTLRLRKPGRRWEWIYGWRDWLTIVRTNRSHTAARHD